MSKGHLSAAKHQGFRYEESVGACGSQFDRFKVHLTQLCMEIFSGSFGIQQLLGGRRKNWASDEN